MARIDELLRKDQTELTADEIQEIVDYRVSIELQNKELQAQQEIIIAESEARLSMEREQMKKSQAVLDELLAQARARFERASNG